MQVEMGLISGHQLNIAPAFWACQLDLFGPLLVFVPGFEKHTRNRQVLEAKVWVMTVVCMTTRAVNLQVLEKDNSAAIVEGVTRLSCEIGVPKIILCDQDPSILSALKYFLSKKFHTFCYNKIRIKSTINYQPYSKIKIF